jgi:hypothetical protein
MSGDLTSRLLVEQRKRLIASILGAAEGSRWWSLLSVAEQRAHRDKVLASVGTFYDFCRDVIKVTGEDIIRNDYAVDLLSKVHDSQLRVERREQVPANGA